MARNYRSMTEADALRSGEHDAWRVWHSSDATHQAALRERASALEDMQRLSRDLAELKAAHAEILKGKASDVQRAKERYTTALTALGALKRGSEYAKMMATELALREPVIPLPPPADDDFPPWREE
jgi:hypothetical protein